MELVWVLKSALPSRCGEQILTEKQECTVTILIYGLNNADPHAHGYVRFYSSMAGIPTKIHGAF